MDGVVAEFCWSGGLDLCRALDVARLVSWRRRRDCRVSCVFMAKSCYHHCGGPREFCCVECSTVQAVQGAGTEGTCALWHWHHPSSVLTQRRRPQRQDTGEGVRHRQAAWDWEWENLLSATSLCCRGGIVGGAVTQCKGYIIDMVMLKSPRNIAITYLHQSKKTNSLAITRIQWCWITSTHKD